MGVVQVVAVGSDGRCTIHYGSSYKRPYGHAKASLLQLELPESALWDLLSASTADLLMGFHQCELEEHDGSRLKTAFGTPWGQFCYKRMPMGLTSSPGCFMRLVDSALRGLPPGMALAYADDSICATAGDMEQHMQDVAQVFGRLIEAGFTVRCDKVHVGMKSVPYFTPRAGIQCDSRLDWILPVLCGVRTTAQPAHRRLLRDATEAPSGVARVH